MKLPDLLLAKLEREAAGTRSALERLPEGRNDWKPHPKSMPLGYLASLVATMPSWVVTMVKKRRTRLEVAPSRELQAAGVDQARRTGGRARRGLG